VCVCVAWLRIWHIAGFYCRARCPIVHAPAQTSLYLNLALPADCAFPSTVRPRVLRGGNLGRPVEFGHQYTLERRMRSLKPTLGMFCIPESRFGGCVREGGRRVQRYVR
jgi:hypothetical protein